MSAYVCVRVCMCMGVYVFECVSMMSLVVCGLFVVSLFTKIQFYNLWLYTWVGVFVCVVGYVCVHVCLSVCMCVCVRVNLCRLVGSRLCT